MVFVDHGWAMPGGQAALLKSGEHLQQLGGVFLAVDLEVLNGLSVGFMDIKIS